MTQDDWLADPQYRDAVKRRAVTQALFLLRQSLLEYRPEGLA